MIIKREKEACARQKIIAPQRRRGKRGGTTNKEENEGKEGQVKGGKGSAWVQKGDKTLKLLLTSLYAIFPKGILEISTSL